MDFKTEAKESTCPMCGGKACKESKMLEENIQYPIIICTSCGWWG